MDANKWIKAINDVMGTTLTASFTWVTVLNRTDLPYPHIMVHWNKTANDFLNRIKKDKQNLTLAYEHSSWALVAGGKFLTDAGSVNSTVTAPLYIIEKGTESKKVAKVDMYCYNRGDEVKLVSEGGLLDDGLLESLGVSIREIIQETTHCNILAKIQYTP